MFRIIAVEGLNKFDYIFSNYTDLFTQKEKQKIAVIGYGWAGRSFCENIDKKKYDIDIYEKNEYFLDTPKLKFITNYFNSPQIYYDRKPNFIQKKITKYDINYENKIVNFRKYDKIIMATGSKVNTYNIKGSEYCHFLKTYEDYYCLKIKLNELSTNSKIIIIGGGPTGIELGSNLSKIYNNITIIDAFDILPGFSTVTKNHIKNNHQYLNLITNQPVEEINLENNIYKVKTKKNVYNCDLIIYTAGIKPNKNVPNFKDIYIIGDLSKNGPPTAQKARAQGMQLAKCLNKELPTNNYFNNYKESGRLLHLKNEIIYDNNNKSMKFPLWFGYVFDFVIDNNITNYVTSLIE